MSQRRRSDKTLEKLWGHARANLEQIRSCFFEVQRNIFATVTSRTTQLADQQFTHLRFGKRMLVVEANHGGRCEAGGRE